MSKAEIRTKQVKTVTQKMGRYKSRWLTIKRISDIYGRNVIVESTRIFQATNTSGLLTLKVTRHPTKASAERLEDLLTWNTSDVGVFLHRGEKLEIDFNPNDHAVFVGEDHKARAEQTGSVFGV